MLELTEQQAAAIEDQKSPLRLVDPRTGEVYVLIRKDVYELTCMAIGGGKSHVWDDAADDDLIRKTA
jgi:hypothetical protein